MSRTNPDNPPYITIAQLYGIWRVERMQWDSQQDSYLIARSIAVKSKAVAILEAIEMAKREGLEYRP